MRRLKLSVCLLAVSQFTPMAIAATENSCIPAFIEKSKKYYFDTGTKEIRVKVLKIDPTTCWLSVKEVLPKGVAANHFRNKKKLPFWLNMNNVRVVRKHAEEEIIAAKIPG